MLTFALQKHFQLFLGLFFRERNQFNHFPTNIKFFTQPENRQAPRAGCDSFLCLALINTSSAHTGEIWEVSSRTEGKLNREETFLNNVQSPYTGT